MLLSVCFHDLYESSTIHGAPSVFILCLVFFWYSKFFVFSQKWKSGSVLVNRVVSAHFYDGWKQFTADFELWQLIDVNLRIDLSSSVKGYCGTQGQKDSGNRCIG
jgi:hypothetical protein